MKTPDEIKKGLECLVRGKYQNAYCGDCPYHANATQYLHECKAPEIITDTIAYIRQLEAANVSMQQDLDKLHEAVLKLALTLRGYADMSNDCVRESWEEIKNLADDLKKTEVQMGTAERIKQGLKCCTSLLPVKNGECPFADNCDECSGDMMLKTQALVYIQQLEIDLSKLAKDAESLRNEKAALLADLKDADMLECSHCAHYSVRENDNRCDETDCDCSICKADCICRDCINMSNWKWRGIQNE